MNVIEASMAALSAKASKIEASQAPLIKDTAAVASTTKTVEAGLGALTKETSALASKVQAVEASLTKASSRTSKVEAAQEDFDQGCVRPREESERYRGQHGRALGKGIKDRSVAEPL